MCRAAPRFPAALALLLAVAVLQAASGGLTIGADRQAPTVRLVIDYGDGVQVHFTALKWRDGMTALDALSAAQAHHHGITFTQKGSGANAMITKIGDVKNEGAGKNWIYYVNDKTAEVSAGIQAIKAGDTVLWKFEVFHYN